MKKAILFTILSISSVSFAQEIPSNKVPAEVLASFKTKFPMVTKSIWEMENEFEYEADFVINEVKHSALFNKSGKWLETEIEIKTSDLPKTVSSVISKEFNDFKVVEAEKVETAHDGTLYEVKVEKGKESYEVLVSSSGKILKKEKEEENQKE